MLIRLVGAQRINMTRQGVRFHIKNLEKENFIFREGFQGKKNIVFAIGGRRCLSA